MGVLNPTTRPFALLASLALVTACGPESAPQSLYGPQSLGTTDASTLDLGEVQATFTGTIDGTWLMYSQTSTCIDVASSSSEFFQRTLYLIETVENEWGVLEETWQACEMELSEVLALTPAVSQSMLETTWPIVVVGGQSTGATIGDGYASSGVPELWGLDLEDPLNSEIPDIPRNADTSFPDFPPEVIDSDEDGWPGITLTFDGGFCEAYIAQRTIHHFYGEYTAPDRIEGGVVSTSVQHVLGADNSLCGAAYDRRSNDRRNTFTRIRVDGRGNAYNADANNDGQISCDEVVQLRPQFFEYVEIDDDSCDL
ncbi:MAG: hypothetical protein KC561_13080, partial [Myxococcales bacterium]|nr:hypothetical protein [Myxococcales bacterium]